MARTRALQVMAAAAVALGITMAPSAASAEPPHGDGGHVHHVGTGNGECVSIDEVAFHPGARGLHRGADASGPSNGPWHGPCT
jgi:hypothetical protein